MLEDILKISLFVALFSAIILFAQNTNNPKVSDPWFIPILISMVWITIKY